MARFSATLPDFYGPTAAASVGNNTSAASMSLGTGASTNANLSSGPGGAGGSVPITTVFANLEGSIFASPLLWLFALVLFLVAWKLIEEHRGGKETFTKIRVDGTNTIKVGLMAVVFLVVIRYFAARYRVPGVSDLIVGGT
jgi:hypothetical protein